VQPDKATASATIESSIFTIQHRMTDN
jgi:hypothetical protein